MEDRLNDIFSNINDWLRYAETKSAALLATNGLVIFGIFRVLHSQDNINSLLIYYSYFVVFLLVISSCFLLISFSPSLQIPWLFKPSNVDEKNDNLLFFGHAAKYTPQKYLDTLAKASDEKKYQSSNLELMIAKQIIANSTIAIRKFNIFNIAIWLTISAIITPIAMYIIKGKSH
ncbi:MAG: DUF5706 domain-containing protein [Thalassotalea sp.]|nr:DUF5706 domain-containing protein [Thalassotalea sp.]